MAAKREERRLAAIPRADEVGYSRLMEADEKGTLARLQAHRRELFDRKVADRGGSIVNLMAGRCGRGTFAADWPQATAPCSPIQMSTGPRRGRIP